MRKAVRTMNHPVDYTCFSTEAPVKEPSSCCGLRVRCDDVLWEFQPFNNVRCVCFPPGNRSDAKYEPLLGRYEGKYVVVESTFANSACAKKRELEADSLEYTVSDDEDFERERRFERDAMVSEEEDDGVENDVFEQ